MKTGQEQVDLKSLTDNGLNYEVFNVYDFLKSWNWLTNCLIFTV